MGRPQAGSSSICKRASHEALKRSELHAPISGDVVSALDVIKQAIRNVSEYVTSTAAAVEEQSTVTGEMSANMQQAAIEAASIGHSATAAGPPVHPAG